jgi:hypothetical protein
VTQIDLLADPTGSSDRETRFDRGRGYALVLPRGPRQPGDLYHRGSFMKRVNLRDKAERRLVGVELLQHGVNQTRLAEALQLSRQTLHNDRESYREFGVQGLLHGYSPAQSKDEARHRHRHVNKRRPGAKAIELAALRQAKRAQPGADPQPELDWNDEAPPAAFVLQEPAIDATLGATLAVPSPTSQSEAAAVTEQPYADTHGWEASRYAGLFPVIILLISQWHWLARVMGLFGNGWRLFMVFVLMAVRNIRSIEQLKHERREEAGRLLGLKVLPGLETLWGWFHGVAEQGRATALVAAFSAD